MPTLGPDADTRGVHRSAKRTLSLALHAGAHAAPPFLTHEFELGTRSSEAGTEEGCLVGSPRDRSRVKREEYENHYMLKRTSSYYDIRSVAWNQSHKEVYKTVRNPSQDKCSYQTISA